MVINNKIKRYFKLHQFKILIYGILFSGIFIRLYQLGWRSFWVDEAILANILVKDNVKQIFDINHYSKGAPFTPPIFTIILHFISRIVEPNEFNFRILPALSGILCLPLIYKLTKMFFDKYTALIALFLCSFNSYFVFLSRELKQYTTEALFTLLAIYVAEKAIKNDNKKTISFFLIICILSFGFSHSFIFTLPVISILVYLKLIEKNSHYSSLGLLNIFFGFISFSLYYILFIRHYIFDWLIEYWTPAYVDYSSILNFIRWHFSTA